MNKPIKKAASQAASGKTLPIDYTLKKNNIVNCGVHRLNTIRNELARNGLSLSDVSAQNQQKTLFRTLEYLGARGINTPEGEACGYLKIASRIKELKEMGHTIIAPKESIKADDGLIHNRIARYILTSKALKDDKQKSLWGDV